MIYDEIPATFLILRLYLITTTTTPLVQENVQDHGLDWDEGEDSIVNSSHNSERRQGEIKQNHLMQIVLRHNHVI